MVRGVEVASEASGEVKRRGTKVRQANDDDERKISE
jgi:hypothetical protein